MATTTWIDADASQIPDDHDIVAIKMKWSLIAGGDMEERIIRVEDISPDNDALALELCDRSVMQALSLGAPTMHMVVWFVGGQQMRMKRENWRQQKPQFTLGALKRSTLEFGIEPVQPDEEPNPGDPLPFGDIDLERNDADPTEASIT